jgi:hypothetical protein
LPALDPAPPAARSHQRRDQRPVSIFVDERDAYAHGFQVL